MIEINLLPAEFQKKAKKEFKMPDLPYLRIFGVLAIVVVVLESLLFAGLLYDKSRLGGWEHRLKERGPDFERLKEIKLEALRCETRLAQLNQTMNRPFYWTRLLNAISDGITEDVWLTQLEAQRRTIEFEVPRKKPSPKEEDDGEKKKGKGKGMGPVPQRKARRVVGPTKERRFEYYLMLKGSAPVSGQGTAAIGRFVQSLQEHAYFQGVVSEVKLDKIDRIADDTLFDFTVACRMKSPFGDKNEAF